MESQGFVTVRFNERYYIYRYLSNCHIGGLGAQIVQIIPTDPQKYEGKPCKQFIELYMLTIHRISHVFSYKICDHGDCP